MFPRSLRGDVARVSEAAKLHSDGISSEARKSLGRQGRTGLRKVKRAPHTDEASEDTIRLGDVNPPTGSWLRISREDIDFVELARDVPVLPPVSRQDLTDAFKVEPGFIREDFDHALTMMT